MALGEGVDGRDPEPRRQHAVERGRRAAPLDVPEGGGPRLAFHPPLDLPGEERPDPAEPGVAEGVDLRVLRDLGFGVFGGRAFRHDDDAEHPSRGAALPERRADFVEVERDLGHEDDVRPAGQPAGRGHPSRVAPHDLDDHDPVVRLRGRVEAVDGLHDRVDRGVEPNGDVGPPDIVVHRLGDSDHGDARPAQVARRAERVVPADRDDGVDPVAAQRGFDQVQPGRLLHRIGPGRTQDRAALRQDPRYRVAGERDGVVRDQPPPPIAHADHLE